MRTDYYIEEGYHEYLKVNRKHPKYMYINPDTFFDIGCFLGLHIYYHNLKTFYRKAEIIKSIDIIKGTVSFVGNEIGDKNVLINVQTGIERI